MEEKIFFIADEIYLYKIVIVDPLYKDKEEVEARIIERVNEEGEKVFRLDIPLNVDTADLYNTPKEAAIFRDGMKKKHLEMIKFMITDVESLIQTALKDMGEELNQIKEVAVMEKAKEFGLIGSGSTM